MGLQYASFEVAHSQPTLSAMTESLNRIDDIELGNFLTGTYRRFFTDAPKLHTEEAAAWADAWAYGYSKNGTSIEAAAHEMFQFAAGEGFAENLAANYMHMGALAAEVGRRDSTSPAAGIAGLYEPFEAYCHGLGTNIPQAPWMVTTSNEMKDFCSILLDARASGEPLDRRDGKHRESVLESHSVYEYATRVLGLAWPAVPEAELQHFAELFAEWTGRENPLALIYAYRAGMTADDLDDFIGSGVSPEYGAPAFGLTL